MNEKKTTETQRNASVLEPSMATRVSSGSIARARVAGEINTYILYGPRGTQYVRVSYKVSSAHNYDGRGRGDNIARRRTI